MSEADEIAESLYPGYLKYIKDLGHGSNTSFVTVKNFVHLKLSKDESYAVIDLVIESLNKITAQRNPPPQPK